MTTGNSLKARRLFEFDLVSKFDELPEEDKHYFENLASKYAQYMDIDRLAITMWVEANEECISDTDDNSLVSVDDTHFIEEPDFYLEENQRKRKVQH